MKTKELKKLKKNLRKTLMQHGCIDETTQTIEQRVYASQKQLMHDIEALFSGEAERRIRQARDYEGTIDIAMVGDRLDLDVAISSKNKHHLSWALR